MQINSLSTQAHSFNPYEKQVLINQCAAIKSRVLNYCSSIGARNSSGCQNMVREQITNYLLSNGSPAALELLQEYERTGF